MKKIRAAGFLRKGEIGRKNTKEENLFIVKKLFDRRFLTNRIAVIQKLK